MLGLPGLAGARGGPSAGGTGAGAKPCINFCIMSCAIVIGSKLTFQGGIFLNLPLVISAASGYLGVQGTAWLGWAWPGSAPRSSARRGNESGPLFRRDSALLAVSFARRAATGAVQAVIVVVCDDFGSGSRHIFH
jgi:hypothetical protein